MHASLLSLLLALSPAPGDWPQWRGPDRDNVSRETGWAVNGRPEPRWSAQVGLGYSSVVLGGGRLFTMGHDVEAGTDSVVCLDAVTGEERWRHAFPAELMNKMHRGGTLSTPTLAGDALYALNREGKFFCFEAASGAVRWEQDLRAKYELELPSWGFSASPVLFPDRLVLNLGQVFCLSPKGGELLWRTRDFGHAYSTPVDVAVGGRTVLAVINGTGLATLDLASGEELAFHELPAPFAVAAATPVVVDDKLFVSAGMPGKGTMLQVLEGGGLERLWQNNVMRNKMTGCALWEGHLYGFDEAILKYMDLEGNETWRVRGIGNGSLMIADGKLIVIGGKGELIVAEADPAEYVELSREKVMEGGVYWTTPVLVDGSIYVRSSDGQLQCRDHRAPKEREEL